MEAYLLGKGYSGEKGGRGAGKKGNCFCLSDLRGEEGQGSGAGEEVEGEEMTFEVRGRFLFGGVGESI